MLHTLSYFTIEILFIDLPFIKDGDILGDDVILPLKDAPPAPARHLQKKNSAKGRLLRNRGGSLKSLGSLRSLGSAKGRNFRGASLENVVEDAEADMDGELINSTESGKIADTEEVGGNYQSSRRGSIHKAGSGRSQMSSFRTSAMASIHVDESNSSLSSASSQSNFFGQSVNMMDFGVSTRYESMRSIAASTASGNLNESTRSDLVDSDGFMGWARGSQDSTSSSSIVNPGQAGMTRRASNSSGLSSGSTSSSINPPPKERGLPKKAKAVNESTMSLLVDSQGFLGWESRRGLASSGASSALTSSSRDGIERTDRKKDMQEPSAAQDDENKDTSAQLYESWHIEDYEGDPRDVSEPIKSSDSGHILSHLSKKVTEGIVPKGRHKSWTIDVKKGTTSRRNKSWTIDGLRNELEEDLFKPTNVTLIRRGRRSTEEMASAHHRSMPTPRRKTRESGGGPLRTSFKTFFGGRRTSDITATTASSSGTDEVFDSRPAIRINREDGVGDIRELRRELYQTGNNDDGNANNKNILQKLF